MIIKCDVENMTNKEFYSDKLLAIILNHVRI